ncbi:hypothetical protein PUNSTDRAFT_130129 [Punctularia strigosozonata HHB-11173 SS5]|uniref:uncharacterized protein n=1 Tax=Punctularia strigosozonata (strain HHB-11173) TaxID=741275 RepID=UPI0004418428|nr:uncharacterized protein PUNSTDRAFT_130129 [Punctularia strigosozonata HHB-11173 SS5]EIN14504.1 hypothetical protein PUNSTDRAFT_130129 [Punctularia strigosozonata HHB-11173 SS5]
MLPILSRRRKTCPQCRAVVRERPAEAWIVKDMVAQLVRSELAPDVHSPPASLNHNLNPQSDPWETLFPKPISNDARHHQFARGRGEPVGHGMFDEDDGVYRCYDCMHEIWDGRCSGCGREYHGHIEIEQLNGVWLGDDVDDIDEPRWLGSEDDEDDDDDDDDYGANHTMHEGEHAPGLMPVNGLAHPGFHDVFDGGMLPWLFGPMAHQEHGSDFEEETEDDGYESSFIDDGEEPQSHEEHGEDSDVINLVSDEEEDDVPGARRGVHPRGPMIVSSDGEEDEMESIHEPPRPRSHGRTGAIIISSGSESEGEPLRPRRRPSFRRAIREVEDDENDDGSINRPPMHLAGYFTPHRTLAADEYQHGDEDDELGEDDDPPTIWDNPIAQSDGGHSDGDPDGELNMGYDDVYDSYENDYGSDYDGDFF